MRDEENLVLVCLVIFLICFVYVFCIWLPSKQDIHLEECIIVDKYSEVSFGTTRYIVLLDNDDEVSLQRKYWIEYEVGDGYNVTVSGWDWNK